MRHIVLFALAIATAFWLAPALHVLPQDKKTVAEVVIFAVFVIIDLAAAARRTARHQRPAPARTRPYAASARRR